MNVSSLQLFHLVFSSISYSSILCDVCFPTFRIPELYLFFLFNVTTFLYLLFLSIDFWNQKLSYDSELVVGLWVLFHPMHEKFCCPFMCMHILLRYGIFPSHHPFKLLSFTLQPHVDFGLKLCGADLMSIPGLYRVVQV